jgi:hypothetical protein
MGSKKLQKPLDKQKNPSLAMGKKIFVEKINFIFSQKKIFTIFCAKKLGNFFA